MIAVLNQCQSDVVFSEVAISLKFPHVSLWSAAWLMWCVLGTLELQECYPSILRYQCRYSLGGTLSSFWIGHWRISAPPHWEVRWKWTAPAYLTTHVSAGSLLVHHIWYFTGSWSITISSCSKCLLNVPPGGLTGVEPLFQSSELLLQLVYLVCPLVHGVFESGGFTLLNTEPLFSKNGIDHFEAFCMHPLMLLILWFWPHRHQTDATLFAGGQMIQHSPTLLVFRELSAWGL